MSYLPDQGSLEGLRAGRTGFIGQIPLSATSLPAGSVGTAQLQNGSVTTAKLAAGAVTGNELANNSVTSAKIVDGTIVAADLANTGVAAGTYTSVTVNAQGQVTAGTNPATGSANTVLYAGQFYRAFAPADNQATVTPFVWGNGAISGGIVSFLNSVLTVNLTASPADKVAAINFSSTGASVGNTVTFVLEMQYDGGGYNEIDRSLTQVTSGPNTSTISYHQACIQGHVYDFRIALTVANAGVYTLQAGATQYLQVMITS